MENSLEKFEVGTPEVFSPTIKLQQEKPTHFLFLKTALYVYLGHKEGRFRNPAIYMGSGVCRGRVFEGSILFHISYLRNFAIARPRMNRRVVLAALPDALSNHKSHFEGSKVCASFWL